MHVVGDQVRSGAKKDQDALLLAASAEGVCIESGRLLVRSFSSSHGVWCDLRRVISMGENPDAYRK